MTSLSADRPSTDPKYDLFGHAPFAKSLADSIRRYPDGDGLVLALYGPWGSGKSTVLNYVAHYLDQTPEEERPEVMTFNPWWFSGRENLAQAFLGQLQAVLPARSKKFKNLGSLLGDFSEGIGGLIDLSGVTGGVASKIGKLIGMAAKRKSKDVPALKGEICKVLEEAGKRILIVVDDIDRLTPEETRQLFTVIKALADFPNVVYLLAFDRDVAAQAIEQQGGLPGERYLEKIIQVPFELLPVDRVDLRKVLFERLDQVLGNTPDGLFDQAYWTNMFFDGIDPMIKVPRDVVRLTNTLSVTYPVVCGEVNPVDFIALEAIRVFLPELYDTLRAHPHEFSGHSDAGSSTADQEAKEKFRKRWMSEIPEELRSITASLIERVFPKTGSMGYGPDWLSEWRRELRACHPELFPIYFKLTLPSGAVSRKEMEELLSQCSSPRRFESILLEARETRRLDSTSKARELLERLMDHVEKDIPEECISEVVEALLNVGDDLIDPMDERGMFDFWNISRVSRPVYHLLKRLPEDERIRVLKDAIGKGRAIATQSLLLRAYEEPIEKNEPEVPISAEGFEMLKKAWIDRVEVLSNGDGILDRQELPRVLAFWKKWANVDDVREWVEKATESEEGLIRFVASFLQYTKSQTFGDAAVRIKKRLNPKWLEEYLDIAACAERLKAIAQGGEIAGEDKEAVDQFLLEYDMIGRGIDPDGIGAFDD